MDNIAENGSKERSPRLHIRFSLDVENEWADTGRGSQTCLARPNSQVRTGIGKIHVPSAADYEQDYQPEPVGA